MESIFYLAISYHECFLVLLECLFFILIYFVLICFLVFLCFLLFLYLRVLLTFNFDLLLLRLRFAPPVIVDLENFSKIYDKVGKLKNYTPKESEYYSDVDFVINILLNLYLKLTGAEKNDLEKYLGTEISALMELILSYFKNINFLMLLLINNFHYGLVPKLYIYFDF